MIHIRKRNVYCRYIFPNYNNTVTDAQSYITSTSTQIRNSSKHLNVKVLLLRDSESEDRSTIQQTKSVSKTMTKVKIKRNKHRTLQNILILSYQDDQDEI